MRALAEQFAGAKAALLAEAPRISETLAQTALALVTVRIQNDGLAAARYTEKSVPKFFFASKAFNAGGRAYAKGKGKGTYPGFKAASGLKSDVVTLTLTGRMFRSLTTLYVGVSGTVYRSSIVAADKEGADKVRWNSDRYGDFLRPDAAEMAEVQQVGQKELARIIRQYFPGT